MTICFILLPVFLHGNLLINTAHIKHIESSSTVGRSILTISGEEEMRTDKTVQEILDQIKRECR